MEALLGEIRIAIQKAGKTDSLAFDTWGVDFGLLDADGKLLEDPVHYRDERTKDWPQRVAQKIDFTACMSELAIRFWQSNTVPVAGITRGTADLLRRAKHLLFIPDLLAAMLGADLTWERSIASTSQMWNPVAGTWDLELLRQMGMDPGLFGAMTDSGSIIGALPDSTKIIAVAGHDTQCAVRPCLWKREKAHVSLLWHLEPDRL